MHDGSVKTRLLASLKKRQFDVALPLLSAMKETWPSDDVFTAPPVTDNTSDDCSLSTDEDNTVRLVDNMLGYLQHIFLGEQFVVLITKTFLFLYLFLYLVNCYRSLTALIL